MLIIETYLVKYLFKMYVERVVQYIIIPSKLKDRAMIEIPKRYSDSFF